nr:pectinesterase inhibitor-like [Nicotiana tomentosiformis]
MAFSLNNFLVNALLLTISSSFSIVKADLVSDVCSKVTRPTICEQALRSDPHTKTAANLEALGFIAIDLAQSTTKSTINLIDSLLKGATDPTLKSRYNSCKENYADASDNLAECPGFLKAKDYGSLNARASAALDDPDSCDDNFSQAPAEPAGLKQASLKLQSLCAAIDVISNSLNGL